MPASSHDLSESRSSLSEPDCWPGLIDNAMVITGATASGKSALAIELANRVDGELLSLDSIAVYKGMDIGTAKPTAQQRQLAVHHLIDLVEPDQDFSVAHYMQLAHQCVQDILDRGKVPIFVGGTPMFLKGILRGFDAGPPPDWEFRNAVEADVQQHGVEALMRRLQQVDPLSATRIEANDVRRIVRALEVAKSTGVPLSHRQTQFDVARPAAECQVYSLQHPRPKLHQRINQRVEAMFQDGLVDEVRSLIEQYGTLSRTAGQAVGYREVIQWLDSDQDESDLREQVAIHTRQLAKRQETWFRSFTEITALTVNESTSTDELIETILQHRQALAGSQ
ncbi:MAG: tRNA (adenosine(37)-N6)-dimethylallyltransferase MiaA [Rhodopirellula sp. TMED11]|nr:MAG: tRNA (adenosine(37)-N6)-dimethylallyltransferase MiaA [Rhodopirellula sp. TMED11]